jgi:hypothetical protein
MSEPVPDHIRELLAQSLAAWQVAGGVSSDLDGTLRLTCGNKQLCIARAPGNTPFRWMVSEGVRGRGVTSIAGLLRTVRNLIDPGYRPIRLRVAPLPVVLP